MSISVNELKKRAIEAIDKNKDKIIAVGDSIFAEPELGYKEIKTAQKIKDIFDELGYEYEDEIAKTGIIARRKGKDSKIKVAIMAELDAVVSPEHPHADPVTGAAHACGHNAMLASLIGVAYALHETGITEELSGDIVLMAVPAEEYVEIEYRNNLIEAGEITFLGGKQEFIKLGVLDDIDMMIMQHTDGSTSGQHITAYHGSNGFMGKLIRYEGKEAHAGGAPHLGVNALNAAMLGLAGINALRETFRDEDNIRVHPIITKGGDLVNVVPADVRLESYVRGNNVEAILEANMCVNRALTAGGDAVGAITHLKDIPGYLPLKPDPNLGKVFYNNAVAILGEAQVELEGTPMAGSTDAGDVSVIMPTVHARISGAVGNAHSKEFMIEDKENAYVNAAKCLVMTAIDLLANDAEKGLEIKQNFTAPMTKEEYLKEWGAL